MSFVSSLSRPPVLLGHSMGGLAVQYCASVLAPSCDPPPLAGIVLMASMTQTCQSGISFWKDPIFFAKAIWCDDLSSLLPSPRPRRDATPYSRIRQRVLVKEHAGLITRLRLRWFINKSFGESEDAAMTFFSEDLPREELIR